MAGPDENYGSLRNNSLAESNNEYEQFLRGLSLIWMGLKSSSSALDREGMFKLMSSENDQRIFRDSYKTTDIGKKYFEASGSFTVTVQESDDSKPVLTVQCEFEAHFHGPEPISQTFVDRFVNSEFQLILIPYARQFVSSLTAQMSMPPLIIPLSIGSAVKPSAVGSTKRNIKPRGKARR